MDYIKRLFIQTLFFIIIIACLASISGCANDPQGLRTPQRDVIADIIARAEYDSQHTTIEVVERDVAINLLSKGY